MSSVRVDAVDLDAKERAFEERLECYRRLGHDREAAARWVVEVGWPLSSPVLDIGTGKGLLAVELARRGLAVTSVDPDRSDQLLAARRAERAGCAAAIRFDEGTLDTLAAGDGEYAAAAMMDVLHHLQAAEPVLERVGALVRPGGRLLIAEFTEEGFEIVSRAHRIEGRKHERGPVDMRRARRELASLGWRPDREAVGHHHEVVVFIRGV